MARSPLRISLGGGGTDLPSYYSRFGSHFVSAAISKYTYVIVTDSFLPGIHLKYSNQESCKTIDEIKHPLFRECLRMVNIENPRLEITSLADIPSGTGLGSSGSFTTSLLKALHAYKGLEISDFELAELAALIEMKILGDPVGKQDPFISVFAGISSFTISRSGRVEVSPLKLNAATLVQLEENLLMFYTGITRRAKDILKDQELRSNELEVQENLHSVKALGFESKLLLEQGNIKEFAKNMTKQWEKKKRRSQIASTTHIDEAFQLGLKNGAIGGKLIGAGGGGFLLFYAENGSRLRMAMSRVGLVEVKFRFEFQGTKLLVPK